MSIVIKAQLGEDLRRITVEPTIKFATLQQKLKELFGVPVLKLRYTDEDEDLILVTSDLELSEALQSFNPLRLQLEADQSSSESIQVVLQKEEVQEEPKEVVKVEEEYEVVKEETQEEEEESESSSSEEEEEEEEEQQQQQEQTVEETKETSTETTEDKESLPSDDASSSPLPAQQGQVASSRNEPSEFDFLANEFQYFRIIVQTALESAFQNLRTEYEAKHKPKVDEFVHKADAQRVIILEAIESALRDLQTDINNYPPAQEVSRKVSEGLREIEAFSAPIIENIRIKITTFLEKLFQEKPDHKFSNQEILQEFDKVPLSPNETEELKTNQEEENKEEPQVPQKEEESNSNTEQKEQEENMEDLLAQISDSPTVNDSSIQSTQSHTFNDQVQPQDNFSDDYVYVEGYSIEGQNDAHRVQQANDFAETIWESSTDFQYPNQLLDIQSMGFNDVAAIKAALIASNGDIPIAIDSLL